MTCPHCADLQAEVTELRRQLAYEINMQLNERVRRVFGLTKQQGAILEALRGAQGRALSTETLEVFMEPTGNRDPLGDIDNLVKVQICRIRHAMGKEVIENVWGRGYRLSDVGKLVTQEGLEKADYFRRECA